MMSPEVEQLLLRLDGRRAAIVADVKVSEGVIYLTLVSARSAR